MAVAIAMDHVKEYIHDERHFSARWLKLAKQKTELDVEHIAAGIAFALSIILIQANHSSFFANGILVGVPLLLTYIYPKERPPVDQLLVYWGAFGLVTIFDEGAKQIVPAYWLLKMGLFALLVLKPFNQAKRIADVLNNFVEQTNKDSSRRNLSKQEAVGDIAEKQQRSLRSSTTDLKTAKSLTALANDDQAAEKAPKSPSSKRLNTEESQPKKAQKTQEDDVAVSPNPGAVNTARSPSQATAERTKKFNWDNSYYVIPGTEAKQKAPSARFELERKM